MHGLANLQESRFLPVFRREMKGSAKLWCWKLHSASGCCDPQLITASEEQMIIDLSHKLGPGMPAYPGLPIPQFHVFLAHGDAGKHAHYAPGTTFQIASYELGGNTGTYVDAPFHRHPGSADLAAVPLEKLANLPGIVIPAPEDGPIESAVVSGVAVRGKAVLIHTNWSRRWGGA